MTPMYLRSLGYVQVVDYNHEQFETVGQVDAVLDLIGGETATRVGIRVVNAAMKRSAADLSELAGLLERGDVKPRLSEVFRLDQAREAQDAGKRGRAQGQDPLEDQVKQSNSGG